MKKFIEEFKTNTKDVFNLIKTNTNSKFLRILLYIFISLLFPLLFLIDFISWIINEISK